MTTLLLLAVAVLPLQITCCCKGEARNCPLFIAAARTGRPAASLLATELVMQQMLVRYLFLARLSLSLRSLEAVSGQS